MIGKKQSWFRHHPILSGLLVIGLLIPLGVVTEVIPPLDNLLGTGEEPEGNVQNNSMVKNVSLVRVLETTPSWQLDALEGNKAKLIEAEDSDVKRAEIIQAPTETGWHIKLTLKPIIVEGREWYSLRFRARADDLRKMGVAVSQAHAPWKDLGLYRNVAVMKQWQDFEWEFLASADDDNSQINFDLGGWDVPVEVAEVRLLKLSNGSPKWKLNLREGSEAGLAGIPESPMGIRVAITKSQSHIPNHIQLIQKGVKLKANEGYRIRFNARADDPREMYLAVSQSEYPWEGLGLQQTISLTSDWQQFEMEFVATSTDGNARLYFDLGQQDIPVEINAALLQRKS